MQHSHHGRQMSARGQAQWAKQTKGVPGITSLQGLSKYCLSNLDLTGFNSAKDATPAGKVHLRHDTKQTHLKDLCFACCCCLLEGRYLNLQVLGATALRAARTGALTQHRYQVKTFTKCSIDKYKAQSCLWQSESWAAAEQMRYSLSSADRRGCR